VFMETISQTFIGIKIDISFVNGDFNDILSEIKVSVENKAGNSFSFNYNMMNIENFPNRADKFFENALGNICDSTEKYTFEDYHGVDGVVDLSNENIDELNDAFKEYHDFRKKILEVVGEDWITMINCYLALQGRVG